MLFLLIRNIRNYTEVWKSNIYFKNWVKLFTYIYISIKSSFFGIITELYPMSKIDQYERSDIFCDIIKGISRHGRKYFPKSLHIIF